MEPFAFILCAEICVIQPPTSGQSREMCLYRLDMSLAENPKRRVFCESLDWPYGEIIDNEGKLKLKTSPWLRTQATNAR